ncbi:MAG: hypothetical protein ACLP22_09765 [Solirubrobacteraceae bacterium]
MLGKAQRDKLDPAVQNAATQSASSMEAIIAIIDRSVDHLRASNITPRELRRLAIDRRRSETQAWDPISRAARLRGAR